MDNLSASSKIAAHGMKAQATRLRVISENLANVNSTSEVPGGEPYRRKLITFRNSLDRELERRAQFLGVGDKIELLGALSPDHVRDWMQRSKLLVLPSVEEGLGVVLLEALACGTPCIATNIGGIPDIIHDQVGRLVPARDADALADSINSLLDNPEEWKQKSTTARTYIVENYAWERIAGQIADLYRRVVDQRLESFTSLNQ